MIAMRCARPMHSGVRIAAFNGASHPAHVAPLRRGRPREGQLPECGVVEVKPLDDDAWLTAAGDQVARYRGRYRLVLVTNARDFVLVGGDAAGWPVKLEALRLAESADDFQHRLERPRTFARDVGAGLGEYLTRALSHRAALVEPKDLARRVALILLLAGTSLGQVGPSDS